MSTRRPRIKAAPNLSLVRAKARTEAKDQPTTNSRHVSTRKTESISKTSDQKSGQIVPISSPSTAAAEKKVVDIPTPENCADKGEAAQVKVDASCVEPSLPKRTTDHETTKVLKIAEDELVNTASEENQSYENKMLNEKNVEPKTCPDHSNDSIQLEEPSKCDTKSNEDPALQEDCEYPDNSKKDEVKSLSNESLCEKSTELSKAPKLSTGRFVNGKYLPKRLTSEIQANVSNAEKNQGEKKPAQRRFIGYRNRFKPNLFSRSQQMEVELSRGQTQKIASLPEVNNPTRTRKHSASEESGARKERVVKDVKDDITTDAGHTRTRPKKTSVCEEKEAVSGDVCQENILHGDNDENSPTNTEEKEPIARQRNLSSSDKSGKPQTFAEDTVPKESPGTREVMNSSVDSPDEIASPARQDAGKPDACATPQLKTMRSGGTVIQRGIVLNGNTPGDGGKRRRRSWSGSNSSGDEINRLKTSTKPRRRTADSKLLPTDSKLLPTDRTNYALKRRKIESKRRFSNGVPGRGKMTMFDLIYYNPDNGTEMARDKDEEDGEERRSTGERESLPPTPVKQTEEVADEAVPEDSALPVPQVKVGANGEIIIDESSTMVETTASKRARNDLVDSTLVVENSNKLTNYGTYSKKRKYNDWSERETFRFYRALSIVGSDFSMMESLFKRRSRHELKLKFKKEEKMNGALVDKCLSQRGQYADLKQFIDEESDDEVEEEKVDRPGRGRRKQGGKLHRRGEARGRKVNNRGMYESSSGGEDADVSETSRSPANRSRHLPTQTADQRRTAHRPNQTVVRTPGSAGHRRSCSSGQQAVVAAAAESAATSAVSLGTATLQKLPGVSFPPALLAANPGLAGARPGSLVVVASPSKTDPTSQLLHVYMVSDKKKKAGSCHAGTPPPGSRSPTPTRQSDLGRFSIDPAVVRAVDRKRASVDRGQAANSDKQDHDSHVYRRQRTLSEGSTISPSKLRSLSRQDLRHSESLESEPYSRIRRSVSRTGDSHSDVESFTGVDGHTSHNKKTETTPSSVTSMTSSLHVSLDSMADSGAQNENSAESNVNPSLAQLQSLPIARKSKPIMQE